MNIHQAATDADAHSTVTVHYEYVLSSHLPMDVKNGRE